MRLIFPWASIDEISSITRSSLIPIASPTTRYGSRSSGSPSWIASSTRRSSSLTPAIAASKLEPNVHEVLLERRQVDDIVPRLSFDRLDRPRDVRLVLGRNDEPHVEVLPRLAAAGPLV